MKKGLCYMVHPNNQSQNWLKIFNRVVKPAAIESGFTEYRLGMPMGAPGSRINEILEDVLEAELVLIDVTEWDDPTVFYLLGIRHTHTNRTILMTQNPARILPDFWRYDSIQYEAQNPDSIEQFSDKLKAIWTNAKAKPALPDNPVQEYFEIIRKAPKSQEKQAERPKIKFTPITS